MLSVYLVLRFVNYPQARPHCAYKTVTPLFPHQSSQISSPPSSSAASSQSSLQSSPSVGRDRSSDKLFLWVDVSLQKQISHLELNAFAHQLRVKFSYGSVCIITHLVLLTSSDQLVVGVSRNLVYNIMPVKMFCLSAVDITSVAKQYGVRLDLHKNIL